MNAQRWQSDVSTEHTRHGLVYLSLSLLVNAIAENVFVLPHLHRPSNSALLPRLSPVTISHDSYLTFVPPSSSDQRMTTDSSTTHEIDFIDEEIWDDWDLPSTSLKRTPGKIRTMSSPAVHSRTNKTRETTTIVNLTESNMDAPQRIHALSHR